MQNRHYPTLEEYQEVLQQVADLEQRLGLPLFPEDRWNQHRDKILKNIVKSNYCSMRRLHWDTNAQEVKVENYNPEFDRYEFQTIEEFLKVMKEVFAYVNGN